MQNLIQMNFRPVQSRSVTLPAPWRSLETQGFHPDLMEVARRFMIVAERDGFAEQGGQILEWAGDGFTNPFDRTQFEPAANDPDLPFKRNFLDAIDRLAADFGNRVPSVVWQAFAFLGTRPNPHEEAMIPDMQEYLPMHYGLADTVLHGASIVYGFMNHVQSRVYEYAGVVLEHGCGCSHSARELKAGAKIECFLEPSEIPQATFALLIQLLCMAKSIMVDGYPFNLGLSPEFVKTAAA